MKGGSTSALEFRGELCCLAGATASGKSAVAVVLASRLKAEIISVDSMQVYRELDLGTAKPDAVARARVPHHLVDVVGLEETFDAARFVALAQRALKEIHERAHQPLFCGGTGLYYRALFDGLGEAPPSDPSQRAGLEELSTETLVSELMVRDPQTAEKIDRQNRRRLIRALEVCRLTGRPYSSLRADWNDTARDEAEGRALRQATGGGARFFALRRTPADLRQRIESRIDEMFARGLVDETRRLLPQLAGNLTAAQALGYRQVMKHLRGEQSLAATIQEVKTRTWQYARRQSTWFRRQHAVEWLDCAPDESAEQIAERIWTRMQ